MPRLAAFLVVVLLAALSTACGTKSAICKPAAHWSDSITYAKTNPGVREIIAKVPADKASVVIVRLPQFYHCAGQLFVQVDGEEVGALATYSYFVIDLPPGTHEISANDRSVWSKDMRSYTTSLQTETFPGRAYFFTTLFAEGSVDVRQVPPQDVEQLLAESKRILTRRQAGQTPGP